MPRLMEIADIQTGPFGSQLHKEDYVEVGTPIVTVEHLGEKNFTEQNLPKVSDTDKERLAKYVLEEGDTVFSRVGSVDRCSYVDVTHAGWMFSGRCLRVRPQNMVNPEYLYYFFTTEETKQLIRNIAVGATMPSINTKILNEIEVELPSLEKQRKVVSILTEIDKKIQNNREINRNLEQQVSILYQAWFEEYINSDGIQPDTWSLVTLSDIAEINSGKRPPMKSPQQTDEAQIPLVGAASVMGFTSRANHSEKILVTGRVGTHGVIQRFNSPCWTSDNTLVITSKYYEYVGQILKRIDYPSMNRGSTQPLITQGDMNKVTVLLPDSNTLNEFEKLAGTLMEKHQANVEENSRLAMLRDALLPKLMSGELDVSDIEL